MKTAILLAVLLTVFAYSCSFGADSEESLWSVRALSPWVEATADSLPEMLGDEIDSLTLSGPRNDWLTGAFAIASSGESKVRVDLVETSRLAGRLKLRVVGQLVEREQGRTILDPLLGKEEIAQFGQHMVNYQQIKDFPTLKVTGDSPAFLWLTVDLRGVKSGKYSSILRFTDSNGLSRWIWLHINVLDAELPVESPLHMIAWQWATNDDMIRDFLEHGVDVTYRDHEKWWKLGGRFLLFQFGSTFNRKPLDDAQKELIKKELDTVYELINRLKVPRDQWALYISDEPSDSSAKQDLAAMEYIKKLRPKTPIFTNPAWGMQADKEQNTATLEGTINVLDKYTDIWCPYCWHLWDGSGVYAKLKSTGKPLWFYEIYTQAANQRPQVGRDALRMLAWTAWRYDTQGIGMFSANDVANDWWRDLPAGSNGYANYSFTYSGVNGITSSRAFEALRQGIQEHKRLYVLKKLHADPAKLKLLEDTVFVAAGKPNGALVIDSVREKLDDMLVEKFKASVD